MLVFILKEKNRWSQVQRKKKKTFTLFLSWHFFCSSWFQGLRWVPMTMYCKKLTSKYLRWCFEADLTLTVKANMVLVFQEWDMYYYMLHKYFQTFYLQVSENFIYCETFFKVYKSSTNPWIHNIFYYLPNKKFIVYVGNKHFEKYHPIFLWRCYFCNFK